MEKPLSVSGHQKIEATPVVDNSVVRLPVSDSESVGCEVYPTTEDVCGKPAAFIIYWYPTGRKFFACEACAALYKEDEWRKVPLSDAPQRSGGERRKANKD